MEGGGGGGREEQGPIYVKGSGACRSLQDQLKSMDFHGSCSITIIIIIIIIIIMVKGILFFSTQAFYSALVKVGIIKLFLRCPPL